jgi:hypothetical protein
VLPGSRARFVFTCTTYDLHVLARELPPPEGAVRSQARTLLGLLEEGRNARERRRLMHALGLNDAHPASHDTGHHRELQRIIVDRLGMYALYRVDKRASIIQLDDGSNDEVLGPQSVVEPTSWIEIELVDSDGKPVCGADYAVICADSAVRRGTTDDKGRAREEGIVPGTCKVSFPKLDGPRWSKAS